MLDTYLQPPADYAVRAALASLSSNTASTAFRAVHRGSVGRAMKKVRVEVWIGWASTRWSVSHLTVHPECGSCKAVIEGTSRRSEGVLLT